MAQYAPHAPLPLTAAAALRANRCRQKRGEHAALAGQRRCRPRAARTALTPAAALQGPEVQGVGQEWDRWRGVGQEWDRWR
eukprot:357849-Chlamydomonas_euryale.AAC.5